MTDHNEAAAETPDLPKDWEGVAVDLMNDLVAATSELERLRAEVERLNGDLGAANADIRIYEDRDKHWIACISAAQKNEDRAKALDEKIVTLESDNAALKLRVSELEERCEVDDVQWYNELGKVGSPQSEIAALRIRIGELESYVSLDPDLVKLLAGCPPADESLHKLKDARIASLEAQVETATRELLSYRQADEMGQPSISELKDKATAYDRILEVYASWDGSGAGSAYGTLRRIKIAAAIERIEKGD
jgi:chromosome segregation ATPase